MYNIKRHQHKYSCTYLTYEEKSMVIEVRLKTENMSDHLNMYVKSVVFIIS